MSTAPGKALVTGAAGFVGARMVARLRQLERPANALVRRRSGSAIDGSVEWVVGDVTRPETLSAAVDGCDIVFHCAWGGGDSLDEGRRINVEGTRHLMEAAASAGVRRVVHLSTMAVHGNQLPAVLTEDAPLVLEGDPYGVSKGEGETLAFEMGARLGVEVVVLRPTLVYGPGAPLWVVAYYERVLREEVALIDNGEGLANLIYVEDLVDAMLAGATSPSAPGVACLVSGERPASWAEYLGHFSAMCGKPPPSAVAKWKALLQDRLLLPYRKLASRPAQVRDIDLRLMTQRTTVSIELARRALGWTPRTSLQAGMSHCAAWLDQQGYLPRRPDMYRQDISPSPPGRG